MSYQKKHKRTITLNNGVEMPIVGLGVYNIKKGKRTQRVALNALNLGYRLIDTAALYRNEQDVGIAIRESGIPRNKIFVTTKLHPLRCFFVEAAFYKSMKKLGLDYIDLYLIHWPFFRKKEVWKTLENIYKRGHVRAIGVSNYSVGDLKELMEITKIIPTINQVEFHPFLYRKRVLDFCKSKNIVVEAHSPLTHGKRIDEENITNIAKRYYKSNSQILLRWSLQHGNIVIPKAESYQHLKENLDLFSFSINKEDMKTLNSLNENYHAAFLSKFSKNY
ncbi:MAG: aldo/keto reductase [bacterium]|nr:aldo/keto reductase [bacterium]